MGKKIAASKKNSTNSPSKTRNVTSKETKSKRSSEPEKFAVIHFPFLEYLRLERQYGIYNENSYWGEDVETSDIVIGTKVIVKSRDGNNSLRFDRGLVIDVSADQAYLAKVHEDLLQRAQKKNKKNFAFSTPHCSFSTLDESGRKNSESHTDELSEISCNVSETSVDECLSMPSDEILRIPWPERVRQYRTIAKAMKRNINNLKTRMYHAFERQKSSSPTSVTSSNTSGVHSELSDVPTTEENTGKMVTIGPGGTQISKYVYRSIDWKDYKGATRKLLVTLFPVSVLATHSLTGLPSPAFKGRERTPKMKLDPVIVSDICFIVTKKSKVSLNLIRHSITIKCADENKMQRMRNEKQKRKSLPQ